MSTSDHESLVGLTGGPLDNDRFDIDYNKMSKRKNDSKPRRRDFIASLTNTVTSNYDFKTFNDTEKIYWYDSKSGIYQSNGKSIIEAQVEAIESNVSTHEVNEIINHVKRRTLTPRSSFDSQIEWLTTGNCVVNLKTLETRPYSSEFMATIRIPIFYCNPGSPMNEFYEWVEDPIACKCPAILKFMREVIAPEDVETVLDFIAYCLWRRFPFHQYILFNGSGRNGKGVMLEIIKRFLGHDNVSGESLHRLLGTRFATAELYGKLANIDADLSKEALKNTGVLKKLTGGDYIPAEKKFLPPFRFVNYAKLLFSANDIPITEDESDAFFSRLIIINFPNQFLGDKADPYLIDKLTTEQEMSGLLKLILRRFPRVMTEGISTASSSIDENYENYILSSNSERAYFEAALEYDNDRAPLKSDVYKSYKMFCKANKLAAESEQSFSRRLKKEFSLKDMQMRDEKGGRAYYWVGIRIRDWKPIEEGQGIL
jgi:putative DNA primase/helicase